MPPNLTQRGKLIEMSGRSPDTTVHEEVGPDATHVGYQDVAVVGWTDNGQHDNNSDFPTLCLEERSSP